MGKSTQSCFKILACGSHSVDHEDLQATESKSSNDRRGWSFRKRSARHRVLSNNVSAELPSSVNKESPEPKSVNIGVETGLDVSEKIPVTQLTEEEHVLQNQPETRLSDIIVANEEIHSADGILDEASIITIQAVIRGLLAQKEILKAKNIIKLQAAVRGDLVRRHAVGALRGVQAIIRIQKHVRARRSSFVNNDSTDSVRQIKTEKRECQGKNEAKPDDRYTYVSIEKLLRNAFANQLVESMPRTKTMKIKCEPLKLDASWKWLESWSSVSVVRNEERWETGSAAIESYSESHVPSNVIEHDAPIPDSHPESVEASEDETQIIYYANDLSHHPQKQVEASGSHSRPDVVMVSALSEIKETEVTDNEVTKSLCNEESKVESLVTETKLSSSEQPGTEAKRFIRKASNPAFIAAQSKFEDLSSASVPLRSTSFSSYDSGVKLSFDKYSSATDQSLRSRSTAFADSAISTTPGVQIGGSECGTELSISSALDSPDGSETGITELQHETKVPYETSETNDLEEGENLKSVIWESSNRLNDSSQLGNTPKSKQNEPHLEVVSVIGQLVSKSSPEGSPKSHMSHITIPGSQATPSSQVSTKPKKRKSKSTTVSGERSHSNYNQDSVSRNSLDQHRSGKRRSSFGSGKLDQEPRDSNSSSSSHFLPSYMQPTESARAKAIVNNSPRSSPDVVDKDIYTKKRHSLPGSNERHESPRIHRSLMLAQQNEKGNETQSPQERKWRR